MMLWRLSNLMSLYIKHYTRYLVAIPITSPTCRWLFGSHRPLTSLFQCPVTHPSLIGWRHTILWKCKVLPKKLTISVHTGTLHSGRRPLNIHWAKRLAEVWLCSAWICYTEGGVRMNLFLLCHHLSGRFFSLQVFQTQSENFLSSIWHFQMCCCIPSGAMPPGMAPLSAPTWQSRSWDLSVP